jgi:tetratricopeptide (TPR) repeat protein
MARSSKKLPAHSPLPAALPAWHEKSVPYLKRGDFATWRRVLDKAVALDSMVLAYRGWCRYEFLRDYAGGLQDLQKFDTLSGFFHMQSNNGDYELHIVMALCERALGRNKQALDYFGKSFGADSAETWYYLALAHLAAGDKVHAKAFLLQAKALFTDTTGKYYIHDPYCEKEDAVYPADVDKALAEL